MFGGMQFLASPYPWVFLASIAIGAAVSRATMSTGRKKEPDRARTWKWVFVCIYLSLALLLGLAAVFIPGPEKIVDVRLAYLAAIVSSAAFLIFRFKKVLGIPVLLLAVALFIVTGLFLQSVNAFTGETEIAKVRVISADGSRMKLEVIPREGETELLDLEGEYFAPIVKIVIFDDFWVFLGARTWYRFAGITSFRTVRDGDKTVFRQGNTDFYFDAPAGISEAVFAGFEKYERSIPGVKAVQVEMVMKQPRELGSYSIRIQNDGGAEIIALSE
jgi:hypothetical protein